MIPRAVEYPMFNHAYVDLRFGTAVRYPIYLAFLSAFYALVHSQESQGRHAIIMQSKLHDKNGFLELNARAFHK
jgi:hypothetical protein